MGLTSSYTVAIGKIPELFSKIRDGQAPDVFSVQLLKDWGFTSSNDRALIPLLKALGFLSPDGKPTTVYRDYRDHSRSETVMANALRTAYADIFLIKEHPTESDKAAIQGKFKSYHNVSDHVASLMTKTFFMLLSLADLKASAHSSPTDKVPADPSVETPQSGIETPQVEPPGIPSSALHYNIQIHLPATKDVEVFNAIFKSLKEHIFAK